MLSERPWAPQGVLRGSRDRFRVGFWCPGTVLASSRHRFGIDCHVDFRIDFVSERASETDTDVACRIPMDIEGRWIKTYTYRMIRIDIDKESLHDQ